MKKRRYKCENCGADLIIDVNAESGKCEYCGSVYYIDKQVPAEVHHYFGNIKITPLKVVLSIAVVALLAAAIVIISLYFSGIFGNGTNSVPHEFRHEKAYLYEGTYLVGEDMSAGEFAAFKDPAEERGRILILTDPAASAGTSACLEEYRFANNVYFTVKDGLYVRVEDCNVFRIGDKTVAATSDGNFEGNVMLRGGTDIPVGNYILHNEDKTMQYTDVTCVIDGKEYTKRIGFRSHLNIGDGDYVSLMRGKLFPETEAPGPITDENGGYLPGQYKVGSDIPAGRYKIECGNAGMVAWFVHNKSGSAFFDDDEKISPSSMSGYLDLEDGDYVYIYMALLLPQDGAR